MPDKIIEGRVDLNIQQLEKLITDLKFAKLYTKEFTKEIDALNSFLGKSAKAGEIVPRAYVDNLKKLNQDIPQITENVTKLLSNSIVKYGAQIKTRIDYINYQLKKLEENKSKYTDTEYNEKKKIYELEQQSYVKDTNLTKILDDRLKLLTHAKSKLNAAQKDGAENTGLEEKAYERILVSTNKIFDGFQNKLLDRPVLDRVAKFRDLLKDAHENQASIVRGAATNILNYNKPVKSFQEELDKPLDFAEGYAEKEAKLKEKYGENAEFADRASDDIISNFYEKPVEEIFDKMETAITLFRNRLDDLRSKSEAVDAYSTSDYSSIEKRTSLLKNEQGTSIQGSYDKYMDSAGDIEKTAALKKLSENLTEYGILYKTVGADEIEILEKITSLNIMRGKESEFYGNQAIRTANRIIERSKEEVEVYRELAVLDQKLASGKISKDEYIKIIDEKALKSATVDIEKIEFISNRLKTLLSGGVFVGDNLKVIDDYKQKLTNIIGETQNLGLNVSENSKLALYDLSTYFENLEGKSKELIGDLPKLLQQLSGIEKVQEDLSGKTIVDFEKLGDPTVMEGMSNYSKELTRLISLRAEAQAENREKDELAYQYSINNVLKQITKSYKNVKNDKSKLAEYTKQDLEYMSRLRETVSGLRHTNASYAKDTLKILNTTKQRAEQESISLALAKKRKREEELEAKIKANHAKQYILDEEELKKRQDLANQSRIRNIVILRDMIDELSTRFELLNNMGGINSSKQTAWSVRELADTVQELGAPKKVKDAAGKETGEQYYEVVSKDQLKYLEEIRRFLIKNSALILEEGQNTGVNNTKLKETVETLTEIIARSENVADLNKIHKEDAKKVNSTLKSTSKEVKETTDKTKKSVNLLDKMFKNIGHAFSKVILYVLVRNAIRKIGEAIRFTINASIEYEQAIANVSAVSSATVTELNKLDKAARKAGETTRYSVTDAANALYYMAQAGYTATESIEALNGVLVLAQATGEDMEQTSELMAATMSQFGLSTLDSDKIANIFAASINKSMSSLDKLQTSLRQAGPVAGAMNVSLEDTVGLLDLMYNNGIEGSRAGRALRNTFAEMSNPASKLAREIEKLGLDFSRVNLSSNDLVDSIGYLQDAGMSTGQVMKMFGKVIGPQMTVIFKSSKEELQKYIDEVSNTNHAYEAMEIQNDTLRGDMDKLNAVLTSVGATLGKLFTNPARVFIQFLKNAVLNVSDFIQRITGLRNTADDMNDTITALSKNVDEYSYVVMKLNNKNNDLTATEEKLLTIRKEMLELEYINFAKKLSDEYEEITKQTNAFALLSAALKDAEIATKQYDYVMGLIDKTSKITNKDSLEYKYALKELTDAYNLLITSNIRANNSINDTKNIFRDMDNAQEFINSLNLAQKTLRKFKMPMMYDSTGLNIVAQSTEALEQYLYLYNDLVERPELRFNTLYSGITLFDEHVIGNQRIEMLSVIAEAEGKVNNFSATIEDNIISIARLLESGVLKEEQILIFNPELIQRIKDARTEVKKFNDEKVEGQWVDFDLNEESFTKFAETVESYTTKLLDDLKNSNINAAIDYAYNEQEKAIKEVADKEKELVEQRYLDNKALIGVINTATDAEDEAAVIANNASIAYAEANAERMKEQDLNRIEAYKNIMLTNLAFEKKEKEVELSKEELALIDARIDKLNELYDLESEYDNKIDEANKSSIDNDYYAINYALFKDAKDKEIEALNKAEQEKLAISKKAGEDAIFNNKAEYAELFRQTKKAQDDSLTELDASLEAKRIEEKYNFIAETELTKEQFDELNGLYGTFLEQGLNEQYDDQRYTRKLIQEYTPNAMIIMVDYYKALHKITSDGEKEKNDIIEEYNYLNLDLIEQHALKASAIETQAGQEELAITTFYNSERLKAEDYFQLQLRQLKLEYDQKSLDEEKDSLDEANKNSFISLTKRYNAEKTLREKQYNLDVEKANNAYKAEIALGHDESDAYHRQFETIFEAKEKLREDDLKAQKEYTKQMIELGLTYAESMVGMFSDIAGAIDDANKKELETKLDTIDKTLIAETEAYDIEYNRQMIEEGYMGELAQAELDRLDAEVEAAIAAGDKEAEEAAKAALKKYLINEWAHQEKLQQLDDDINKARESGTEEEIAAANAAKAKYEIEHQLAEDKKLLEEAAALEKAELEYEYALKSWKLQKTVMIADSAVAIMKAMMAPWPLSIATTSAAVVATGVQIAAHENAKPIPEYDTGGIVLGSSEGTIAKIGEKNKTELISNPEQMANMLLAIGNNGFGNKTLNQTIIFMTEDKRELARYTVDDVLNKGVMTIDARKAIRKGGRI